MSGFLPDLASWALRGGAGQHPPAAEADDAGDADAEANDNNNDESQQQTDRQAQQVNTIAAGTTSGGSSSNNDPPMTAEELRAQRLARMEELERRRKQQQEQEELQKRQQQQQQQAVAAGAGAPGGGGDDGDGGGPEPMDIDDSDGSLNKKPPPVTPSSSSSGGNNNSNNNKSKQPSSGATPHQQQPKPTKTPRTKETSEAKKLQRKKEQMLKKVIGIALVGTSTAAIGSSTPPSSSNSLMSPGSSSGSVGTDGVVVLDLDGDTDITVTRIAEILATRLSMMPAPPPGASSGNSPSGLAALTAAASSSSKPLVAYLGQCYKRAGEEVKSYKSPKDDEILSLLEEIQNQVVAYAASCTVEPDLFEAGRTSREQLSQLLLTSMIDVSTSITIGSTGKKESSFYHRLVEEIVSQHGDVPLKEIVLDVVGIYYNQLSKIDTILDTVDGYDGMMYITALNNLCSHKKVAEIVACGILSPSSGGENGTKVSFLVPPADTPQAREKIQPTMPAHITAGGSPAAAQMLAMMLSGENRPYAKRSGPGIEKHTLLGVCMRLSVPKANHNPQFNSQTILHQSIDSIERINSQQRLQLRNVQDATYTFIMTLIKSGKDSRNSVLKWFQDALAVNVKASGERPDPTKVSSQNFLLNLNVALLKLCQPVVDDPTKLPLVDCTFVSGSDEATSSKGIFTTQGDDALQRLGGEDAARAIQNGTTGLPPYKPKNPFVTTVFFYCIRSMDLGLQSGLARHFTLLRVINNEYWNIRNRGGDIRAEPRFADLTCRRHTVEVALLQPELIQDTCQYLDCLARVLLQIEDDKQLSYIPEDFISDMMSIVMNVAKMGKGKTLLAGTNFKNLFGLVVKLLSDKYAGMVRNYNLRAKLGDVLYELFLPTGPGESQRDIPATCWSDPMSGGEPYLLSSAAAQETLAPSLLLLYGEVEQTGYYDKMSHRAKISSVIKYLWESTQHRPAFRRITEKKDSFITFANGMMNETNQIIATVMQKLPEIRECQELMKNHVEWGQLSEERQNEIKERLDSAEGEVQHALPLCNKTMQMFGFLNTDPEIRKLFLLDELCPRLVSMLTHVLKKLVGSRGLELKVDDPEKYEFRPKEMLRDLCAIFALFAESEKFQIECAKADCDPELLRKAVQTCRRIECLTGESMRVFEALPDLVKAQLELVNLDEELIADAPDKYLDEILSSYMKDPVILPSGHYVDRSTITQHLLNDPTDPFNREPLSIDDLKPATELKAEMDKWLEEKRASRMSDA